MPSGPTGNDDTKGAGSDLPSGSGETFTDLDSLKERLSEDPSEGAGGEAEAEEGPPPDEGSGAPEESGAEETPSGGSATGGTETVRMTFHVDRDTAERLRNAVYWTATPVTLSGTARDALRAAVRQLEEEHNDGEPFPDRDAELKGGNPNLKG